jgi:hypothetical protein
MSALADTGSADPAAIQRPMTYRFSPVWRVLAAVVFVPVLCGGLAESFLVWSTAADKPIVRTLVACLLLIAFAAGIAWQLVIFLTWRVTLAADAIETSSWLNRRRIRRDDIKGLRINDTGQAGRIIVVVASSAIPRKISLALKFMQKDAAFSAWFSGLRNLDAEDLQNSVASIATNAAYGTTPEDRLFRLKWARRIGFALDMVSIALVLWSFIDPRPYPWVIGGLAALPLLALVLIVISRGLFRIGIGAAHAHANLGTACALPAFAIMLRKMFDLNMVDELPLIAAAAICTMVFIAAIALADRDLRSRPWMLVGLALCAGAYAFGALGEANALLDRSPSSVLRSQIIDKHITYGKATTYYFRLAPWGTRSEPADVSVSHDLYDRLEPRNSVCLLLRDGALHMPWFIVGACRGLAR